jgi:hypothetical protein
MNIKEANIILNNHHSKSPEILAACNFNYQVNNGGLQQWHLNGYYQRDVVTLKKYLRTFDHVPAIKKVTDLLEVATPHLKTLDTYTSFHTDSEDFEEAYDALDDLDELYYTLSDDFFIELATRLS